MALARLLPTWEGETLVDGIIVVEFPLDPLHPEYTAPYKPYNIKLTDWISGAASFTELTDTFAAYTDLGSFLLRVNIAENAIEAVDPADLGFITTETDPVFTAWLGATPPAYPGDIPEDLNQLTDNSGLLKWENDIKYGYQYNWHALANIVNPAYSDFIVPSMTEITALMSYLASSQGGKLKQIGTTNWTTPNTDAVDSVGFSALPGGQRSATSGEFSDIGIKAYFWTTSQYSGIDEKYRLVLSHDSASYTTSASYRQLGHSVRLVNPSTTLTHGQTGTYVGNDGKVYKTICINDQEWMSENLAETLNASGVSIPNVTDNATWEALTTPGRCSYNNDGTLVFGGIRPKNNKLVDVKYLDGYFDTYDFASSDETTVITPGTGKFKDHWPFNFTAVDVFVGLNVASTSGNAVFDFNDKNGNSIFSTRPTVLQGEETSLTNPTQPVMSTVTFLKGDAFTIDNDSEGVGVKGVKWHFKGFKT